MAFSLHGPNTYFNNNLSGASTTVTLGYTTQVGDCIVVAMNINATRTLSFSGLGATWVEAGVVTLVGSVNLHVWVGYNCSAGNTTFTFSGYSLTDKCSLSYGVWQGVTISNPIRGSVATGTSASGLSVTTGSLTYVSGDLLIGTAAGNSAGSPWNASVWSNGGSDTLIADEHTGIGSLSTYQISSSGSSTTYKASIPANSQSQMGLVMALEAAATAQQVMIV